MNNEETKQLTYEELSDMYQNYYKIKSLKDDKIYKIRGGLCMSGEIAYISSNEDAVVYDNGRLAEIVERGVDPIDSAINAYRASGFSSPREYLNSTCK